ncbi:MAG: hypothetical protein H7305_06445 [Gemmatimonadaceae bacterium]|nr:hypothetical protein [Gemmatimonadaceae bacterium]
MRSEKRLRPGKRGIRYPSFGGIALETQAFPDASNQLQFPSTILRPGVTYESRTVWRFPLCQYE